MSSIKKKHSLENDIIIIDGLWGTGKSLLGPIVSGMDRVEKVKIEHIYEYVCVLRHLGKISEDAADWMLTTYADLSQYNNVIGREVNLRWRDDSGLASLPNKFKYIKRLFGKEGDRKLSYINDNNVALNIMSHMLLLTAEPILDAYSGRVKFIEIVRHPLYMVKHWCSYLERFDSPREFTISLDCNGNKVPWFVNDWIEEYSESNTMDKALLTITKLFEWLDDATKKANENSNQVLTLSFESIVMEPDKSMHQLEKFLKREHYPKLAKLLRKQKIPRKTISQGKGHAAYGWENKADKTEEQVYMEYIEYINANGSSTYIDKFNRAIEEYNRKYPSILSAYQ